MLESGAFRDRNELFLMENDRPADRSKNRCAWQASNPPRGATCHYFKTSVPMCKHSPIPPTHLANGFRQRPENRNGWTRKCAAQHLQRQNGDQRFDPADIRKITRKGLLVPDNGLSWQWTVNDRQVTSVTIRVDFNQGMALSYRLKNTGEVVEQLVQTQTSPCHLGGHRQ